LRAAKLKSAEAFRELQNAASTFGQEAVGADGGYLVPPDIRSDLIAKVISERSLFIKCDCARRAASRGSCPNRIDRGQLVVARAAQVLHGRVLAAPALAAGRGAEAGLVEIVQRRTAAAAMQVGTLLDGAMCDYPRKEGVHRAELYTS